MVLSLIRNKYPRIKSWASLRLVLSHRSNVRTRHATPRLQNSPRTVLVPAKQPLVTPEAKLRHPTSDSVVTLRKRARESERREKRETETEKNPPTPSLTVKKRAASQPL
ncbi:hypothetical protein NXS19_011791 [Fusarium pseudograminearum]|nr:hypothetical protein NXS19_011791 [Fusarium pseudograminearum]